MSPPINLLSKLSEIERFYKGSSYAEKVSEAVRLYETAQYERLEALLNEFPSRFELLNKLIEKLRGKSVYRTLKRLTEDKLTSEYERLKALLSLGTHIAIECEQGNTEYRMLLLDVYERIGAMLYKDVLR